MIRRTAVLVVPLMLLLLMPGVSHAGLVNPGFETGNFTGWTLDTPVGASSDVVTSWDGDLGYYGGTSLHYDPVWGSYFSLLKTDGPDDWNSISQDVSLAGGEKLEGWAAFDARDWLEIDYPPAYNDTAQVRILDSLGAELAIPWEESVQSLYDVGNYGYDTADKPGYGDGPWESWSWMPQGAGTYTVEYRITNVADSALASYALFDGPQGVPPVPEPASMVLLGLAGSAVGLALKKRRKA